ncbi:MAG TPA: NAD(P)-dependent methylenetetrahydromethanopterin dehydrogenase [Planctomycetaceae bacterium]|nr:NAD(P)-dependent methylenetetrahydromethanopterin dehydrogenase [Planctomycetaceae bacterium]
MKKILIQLDTDDQPSSFDRVVAVDAEVDHIFSYAGIVPETVEPIVHGAMFTRGVKDLAHSAIFIGGSNVAAGEALFEKVRSAFLGPVRVSVMMDSNGSNTTAAAAVLSARKHLKLEGTVAAVLGGTGPVGLRAAQLLAAERAVVHVGSRSAQRAAQACDEIRKAVPDANVAAFATGSVGEVGLALKGAAIVIAAGAAGAELLPAEMRRSISSLKVAIDLNAVPPAGIGGIDVFDKGAEREGVICYGAIGVGGLKMKIHKTALRRLFESNDQLLERVAIYRIGEALL